MIIVDDRESKKVQKALRKYFPDLIVRRLDYGDVIDTEKNIAVERKGDLDMSSSIMDKRLPNQSEGMQNSFNRAWIIKVGTYENVRKHRYHKQMSINRFIGAETDCLCYNDIPVLQCENLSQFARYVDSIFRKFGEDKPRKVLQRKNKKKNDGKLSVLLGIHLLGETRARALLKQFGSIGAICKASEKDLMSVKGIGKKQSVAIKKILY